ncbi:MAG: nitrogen regulatory protein P-II 1 [Ignavibacterium sp.]|nr:MAG: nitrogen regulatory protein P-II 1 [Ignavibacterium sp.]
MKEIKAIIQPFKLTEVIKELQKIEGLPGVTISDIKGFGKTRAMNAAEKVIDDLIEYVPKKKIEIVVHDDMVDKILDVIQSKAHTGNPGDGKIFVVNVENVVKIRTNERGESAI